jgi:hypothetical protein
MFTPDDRIRPGFTAVLSILMMIVFCAGAAQAQTTAFTYQGRLSDAGSPATGQYDLEFRVFDAAVLGNQLATVQLDNVQVTGGVFTVRLDYGGVTPASFVLERVRGPIQLSRRARRSPRPLTPSRRPTSRIPPETVWSPR